MADPIPTWKGAVDVADPEPAPSPDLHAPDRRLDVAFASLAGVRPGAYITLLAGTSELWAPPDALLRQLPEARWLRADDHPLTFVDPQDHLRVHQAWLGACQGSDRVGRVRVRTCAPLRPDDGGPDASPGWYDVEVLDLVGVPGIDAVVVHLTSADAVPEPVVDESDATSARAVSWFRGTSSFRLRLGHGGVIEGGTLNVDELLGRPLTALVGTPVIELAHPDDRRRAVDAWRAVVATAAQKPPTRLRIAVAGGRWRWFEVTSWNLLDVEAYEVVISDFRDVQDQVEAEQAREATTRALDRLVRVLDEVDDVVMVGGLDSGLVYLNAAARRLAGTDAEGTRLADHVGQEINALADQAIIPALRELRRWTGEFDLDVRGERRRMAATVSPVATPVPPPPGDGDGGSGSEGEVEGGEIYYGVIMRDITSAHAHALDLSRQARRDPLTGLPNRLALMEQLEACRTSGPADGLVSVCFIDLDNLKVVNDGLGHSAGDRLLRAVGHQVLANQPGAVARFGGDEFVVVVEDRTVDEAWAVARSVLAAIERVQVPGVAAHLTASIGVTTVPRSELDPETIIRDADAAMYVAKRSGKAQVVAFDDTMRRAVERRFHLERSLRAALEQEDLTIHLQPVIALATDRVSGFEALARWDQAEPIDFIPVAEEAGLIDLLGHQALHAALAGIARIQAIDPTAEPMRIGVNVSGHQLLDPSFGLRVTEALERHDVSPEHLVLELTETVLIDPAEEIDAVLRGLRDRGISLALDDFGSGFSSLGYLRRYPIDILKLDNTYTQGLLQDRGTRIIAEGIVTMANRLGLRVAAEGVETPEQLEVVRSLGFEWAQGHLLGKPAAVDEVIAEISSTTGT